MSIICQAPFEILDYITRHKNDTSLGLLEFIVVSGEFLL